MNIIITWERINILSYILVNMRKMIWYEFSQTGGIMIKRIDDDNFVHEVLRAGELTIVDFSAKWCGPCKMLAPILEKISSENRNVKIVKVDVDDSPKTSRIYSIKSIPMLIFFKNGKVVDEIVGFVPKETINRTIKENL